MNWVTPSIAIGNCLDARDPDLLRASGIRSILSLDGTLDSDAAAGLGVDRIESVRLIDAPGNDPAMFLRAVAKLGELIDEHAPVLVHCHAGRSRSPVVVAGHLLRTRAVPSAEEALRFVGSKRVLSITPGVEALLDYLRCRLELARPAVPR